ncbi:Gfo/Idh/MocA family oxidoreductase [Mesorhizobium sp. B2-4-12]|uniref:Gfo/Idh/MocA family protein n=1 Tax=unclassified Mesorhizobium TaxID=325217 RepID=UPI0011288858|nr:MULTISPECIES: Gfo/Idh/MocA family oxidoreductase [unclassified Mesorhizobium]TPK93904.1 Gfo/Idh/MocA family oxidoreductase [Mesorhizobium sp. B2-4-12]TPL09601.1 Gfo/Idh/MocA family oxidoreductase [Mesorhizobium sp. B2-4-14]
MVYKLASDLDLGPRLPIGMVGGGRGSFFAPYHRAALRLSGRWELVAGVFSSERSRSLEAGTALGVAADRNYETVADLARAEAARSDGIRAACVVTPNHLHFDACKTLMENGIGVICDKPLVNSLEEARELQRLAAQTGVFFGMTYTYCGYPMVREARQLVAEGGIGRVRFVYVEYLQEWLADKPEKLGAKAGGWRTDPQKAGPTGTLGDVGTHAFNLAEFVCGAKVNQLSANMTRIVEGRALDDNDIVQLRFDAGFSGLLWATQAAPGHRNGLRIKVVGSTGSVEWRQEAPETLRIGELGQADRTLHRGQRIMTAAGATQTTLPAGNPEGYHEALAILYSDFADAIEAPVSVPLFPAPGLEEGVRGVALCDVAIRSSSTNGSWLPLDNQDSH